MTTIERDIIISHLPYPIEKLGENPTVSEFIRFHGLTATADYIGYVDWHGSQSQAWKVNLASNHGECVIKYHSNTHPSCHDVVTTLSGDVGIYIDMGEGGDAIEYLMDELGYKYKAARKISTGLVSQHKKLLKLFADETASEDIVESMAYLEEDSPITEGAWYTNQCTHVFIYRDSEGTAVAWIGKTKDGAVRYETDDGLDVSEFPLIQGWQRWDSSGSKPYHIKENTMYDLGLTGSYWREDTADDVAIGYAKTRTMWGELYDDEGEFPPLEFNSRQLRKDGWFIEYKRGAVRAPDGDAEMDYALGEVKAEHDRRMKDINRVRHMINTNAGELAAEEEGVKRALRDGQSKAHREYVARRQRMMIHVATGIQAVSQWLDERIVKIDEAYDRDVKSLFAGMEG